MTTDTLLPDARNAAQVQGSAGTRSIPATSSRLRRRDLYRTGARIGPDGTIEYGFVRTRVGEDSRPEVEWFGEGGDRYRPGRVYAEECSYSVAYSDSGREDERTYQGSIRLGLPL